MTDPYRVWYRPGAMARVHFTRNLKRFFPELPEAAEVEAATVAAAIAALDARYPGVAGWIVDEHGALRKHVNVFIDGEMVADRVRLSDPVGPNTTLHVIQALSGG